MIVNVVVVGERLSPNELKVFHDYWDGLKINTVHPDTIGDIIKTGKGYSKITDKNPYNILVFRTVVDKSLIVKVLESIDFMLNFLSLIVRDKEGDFSQVFLDGELHFKKLKQ